MAVRVVWGDDANFIADRRRLPSALPAAAAAFRRRRAYRDHAPQRSRAAAFAPRPISPSPRTRRSSAPRSSCSSALSDLQRLGFLGVDALFQFDPFHFVATSRQLAVAAASTCSSHPVSQRRSTGPRPGTPRAPARSRSASSSSTSTYISTSPWATAPHTTLPPIAAIADAPRRAQQARELAALPPKGSRLQCRSAH